MIDKVTLPDMPKWKNTSSVTECNLIARGTSELSLATLAESRILAKSYSLN